MTSQQIPPLDLTGAIRRQWWMVVVAVVVALGVAFAASSSVKPTYTASGVLRAGPAALGHGFNAPTPDEMVRSSTSEIRSALVDAGMHSPTDLAGIRFAAVGAPQTRITVTADAADPVLAESLVDAASKAAVAFSRAATVVEIARQKRQIELTTAAIADSEGKVTAFELWEMQNTLIDAKSGLKTVENIYVWDGNVSVTATSRLAGLRTTLSVALLLGGFVGLVLAGVREYLWRRKNASVASA